MSREEMWSGSIKEIFFKKTDTLEDKAEWLRLNGYNIYFDDEELIGDDKSNMVFVVDGRIFVAVTLCEVDEVENCLVRVGDNSYDVTASFYNGGTDIGEVVEELLKEELNNE